MRVGRSCARVALLGSAACIVASGGAAAKMSFLPTAAQASVQGHASLATLAVISSLAIDDAYLLSEAGKTHIYRDTTNAPRKRDDGGSSVPSGPAPPADAPPTLLLLEMVVNGVTLEDVSRAEVTAAGEVVLPDSDWTKARLRPAGNARKLRSGEAGHSLGAVAGLLYKLDVSNLRVTITAPVEAFVASEIDAGRQRGASPARPPPGAYVNYDLDVARSSDGAIAYGGLVDAVLFTGLGSLVNRMILRGNSGRGRLEAIRTETYWQTDLPGRVESIVVGDAISSDGGWSRPVRFGGVRFGRDFSLDPDLITFPLPSIRGSAALPSTVDVLVNNSKTQRDINVTPGYFAIRDLPVVTGAGQANLVVTDLRGIQTVISQGFYTSPRLLSPGLSDFSYEAGAIRQDFGLRSNAYGPLFAAASWRQGLSSALTLSARGEVERRRQAVGVDAVATLGTLALLRVAAAYSFGQDKGPGRGNHGGRYLVGLERIGRRSHFSAEWEHYDRGFEPFGSTGLERRLRDRFQAGGGFSLFSQLSLGARYINQRDWSGDRYRILAANVAVPLPGRMSLSAYVSDRFNHANGWSGGINLVKSLGPRRSVAARVSRSDNGAVSKYLSASQSAPVGPGVGWRVLASDNGTQDLQAGVTLNREFAQFSADADVNSNGNAVRAGMSGAIGWLKGLSFASRQISSNSFAVVKVGNLKDVMVYRENQYSAKTNGNGLALVTGLLPYQKNRLSVNVDKLPFNVEIGGSEKQAVPFARAGMFVNFPIRRSLNALLTLTRRDGTPVPIGSVVTTGSGTEFVVGQRGKLYLTDLLENNIITVTGPGTSCRINFAIDPKSSEEARPEPLTC